MANKFETIRSSITSGEYATRGSASRVVKLSKLPPKQKHELLKLIASTYDAKVLTAIQAKTIVTNTTPIAELTNQGEFTAADQLFPMHETGEWVEQEQQPPWVLHSLTIYHAARLLVRVSRATKTPIADLCTVVQQMAKLENV